MIFDEPFDPCVTKKDRPLEESSSGAKKDIEQILFGKKFLREIISTFRGNRIITASDLKPHLEKLPQAQSLDSDLTERIRKYYKKGLISKNDIRGYVEEMIFADAGDDSNYPVFFFFSEEINGIETALFEGQALADLLVRAGNERFYWFLEKIVSHSQTKKALGEIRISPSVWMPFVEGVCWPLHSGSDFKTAAKIAIGFADATEKEPTLKVVIKWMKNASYLYDGNHGLHRFFHLFLFLAFQRKQSIKKYCKDIVHILCSAHVSGHERGFPFIAEFLLDMLFAQDFVEDSVKLEILEGFKQSVRESVLSEHEKGSVYIRKLSDKFSKKLVS